jgi:hypothetical protein
MPSAPNFLDNIIENINANTEVIEFAKIKISELFKNRSLFIKTPVFES